MGYDLSDTYGKIEIKSNKPKNTIKARKNKQII
jgi:hypothetical protein